MKNKIIQLMRKTGEKAATLPVTVRSWPDHMYQPKLPAKLREQMLDQK